MSYFGVFCLQALRGKHLDDVKPGLKDSEVLLEIELGGGAQALLLTSVHKLPRRAEGGAAAQLHLHEAEKAAALRRQPDARMA